MRRRRGSGGYLTRIWYATEMRPAQRHQFGLPTLLAVTTFVPLWFYWADTVVRHLERQEQFAAAADQAARSPSAPPPALVYSRR